MKTSRLGTIAALSTAALATIGTPAIVHAETASSTPSSACKPFDPKTLSDLTAPGGLAFTQGFVVNNNPSLSRKVICPISRPHGSALTETTVYVDGEAFPGSKVSCAIYSYNYDGTIRGQKSVSGTGVFDIGVTFTRDEAPFYGFMSMICTLPSQGRGYLFGALTYSHD